jgi:Tol biopolymer transport system component
MNADGTAREQLTDDPAEDFDPAWSPDGTQIAFRSHRDGSPEVYLVNADGSGERNLTDSPLSDYSPAWSPTGTQIAFASNRDADSGGNDIYLIDVASGTTQRLTIGGDIDEYPTWSPDGTRIAYACSDGVLQGGTADFELCVMDADGSNIVQVTDAEGLSDYPVWSPDGDLIAFQSTRGGWPTMPGYTPLGYEEGEFGDYDVYIVAPDGDGVRNVTDNGYESDQFPAWSPDGAHIVVSRHGCLVAVALDGAAEAQLSDPQGCADVFADWTLARAE